MGHTAMLLLLHVTIPITRHTDADWFINCSIIVYNRLNLTFCGGKALWLSDNFAGRSVNTDCIGNYFPHLRPPR